MRKGIMALIAAITLALVIAPVSAFAEEQGNAQVASEPTSVSATFNQASSSSKGTMNYNLENSMTVSLPKDQSYTDYKAKVIEPGGHEESIAELNPILKMNSDDEYISNVMRWKYEPSKSGEYTINVYKSDDDNMTTPIYQAKLTLYKITYKSNGKTTLGASANLKPADGGAYEVYCTNYSFITLLPRPQVTVSSGDGGMLGWVLVTDKDKENPTESDVITQFNVSTITGKLAGSQDAQAKLTNKYELELYPAIGFVPVRMTKIFSEKPNNPQNEPGLNDKNLVVDFGNQPVGYAADTLKKTLYIYNAGNVPLTIWSGDNAASFAATFTTPEIERDEDNPSMLKVGGFAELTIQPEPGLGLGSYNEISIFVRADKTNQSLQFVRTKLEVEPIPVTVTLETLSKEYGQTKTMADVPYKLSTSSSAPGISLTKDDGTPAYTLAQLGVTLTSGGFSKTANAQDNVYVYEAQVAEKAMPNFQVSVSVNGTGVKVDKTTPNIEEVSASGIKTGNPLNKSTIEGIAKNKHTQEEVQGEFAWKSGSETMSATGSFEKEFTFTPEDQGNYNPVDGHATVVVSEKPATNIQMNSGSASEVTYDGAQHPLGFTATTEDGTDRTSEITVQYRASDGQDWTDVAPTEAGTYHVKATVSENDDYAGGQAEAQLTIRPKALNLTIDPNAAAAKAYDGNTSATVKAESVHIVESGIVGGDEVTINPGVAIAASFDNANAGTEKPVTVSLGPDSILQGAKAANYSVGSMELHTTGTISPLGITLALSETATATKVFGQTVELNASDFSVSGNTVLPNGETIAHVGLQVTCDGFSQGAHVDSYDIVLKTNEGSNYAVNQTLSKAFTVTQATPQIAGVVSAGSGKVNNKLESVNLSGTFQNEYSGLTVEGKLTWDAPDTTLPSVEGTQSYTWTFTPTDRENYATLTGQAEVMVTLKDPTPLAFAGAETGTITRTYNGSPQAVTLVDGTVAATIQYRFLSGPTTQADLANANVTGALDSKLDWSETPPVHAGTYEVQAVALETPDYAANEIEGTLIINQAQPTISGVSASAVERNGRLADSTLTGTATGVGPDGALTGSFIWDNVGGEAPGSVPVVSGTHYAYQFVPDAIGGYNDYAPVAGSIAVTVLADTRKVGSVVVYNLPNENGDYAIVTIPEMKFYNDDSFMFYKDSACSEPVSAKVAFASAGVYVVPLDPDALDDAGGTVYVKIDGSTETTSVTYLPELDFTLPTTVSVTTGKTASVSARLSDTSYQSLIGENAVRWGLESETYATIEGNGLSATLTGVEPGSTTLTVTIAFAHPDAANHPDDVITVSKTTTVTVSNEVVPTPGGGGGGDVPSGPSGDGPSITVDDGQGSTAVKGGSVGVTTAPSSTQGKTTVSATLVSEPAKKPDSVTVLVNGQPTDFMTDEDGNLVFDVDNDDVVEIVPVFKAAIATPGTFEDVSSQKWYEEEVYQAYNLGYMGGYGTGQPGEAPHAFGPEDTLTRGQAAIVLFNMTGSNYLINGRYNSAIFDWRDTFTDVEDGIANVYRNAVVWGHEYGLITGYTGSTNYGPDDPLSREQVCALLARYAALVQTPGDYVEPDEETIRAELAKYPDADSVSDWARPYVAWASQCGIIGRGGLLAGQGAILRCEMAAMMSRYQPVATDLVLYPTV